MADVVARRTRGLMAIAITDAIHALGLRPISPLVVNLRSFFRVTLPTSATELAKQTVFARRSTAMTIGCVGLLAILLLPILVPIEIIRGARVRRHNRAMRAALNASISNEPGGYRTPSRETGGLGTELAQSDALFAIDWTIWRDGAVCLAGSALGVVRGDEHRAPWITVHRGPPPRDAIDTGGLGRAFPELPLVTVRWEWQHDDPFEAVERA